MCVVSGRCLLSVIKRETDTRGSRRLLSAANSETSFSNGYFPPSLRVVGSNAACLALCRVEYAAGHNRWAEDLQHLAAHIAQSLKDFPIINPATVKAITNTQM